MNSFWEIVETFCDSFFLLSDLWTGRKNSSNRIDSTVMMVCSRGACEKISVQLCISIKENVIVLKALWARKTKISDLIIVQLRKFHFRSFIHFFFDILWREKQKRIIARLASKWQQSFFYFSILINRAKRLILCVFCFALKACDIQKWLIWYTQFASNGT